MLLATVHDLERAQAEREERLTLWPLDELPSEDDDSVITGRMRELMSFARKVARTNVTVLITGESGTGKEVLARAIHGYSARAKKPFVPFNCTGDPARTARKPAVRPPPRRLHRRRPRQPGPDPRREGRHAVPRRNRRAGLDLQPKLLRFLESGEINPLGETSPFTVDVRIVAATNANLERPGRGGTFREDLFYRLNVICLSIPPLRERRDEIPALVHHFVAKAANEFGKGRVRVAEETMEHLLLYPLAGQRPAAAERDSPDGGARGSRSDADAVDTVESDPAGDRCAPSRRANGSRWPCRSTTSSRRRSRASNAR